MAVRGLGLLLIGLGAVAMRQLSHLVNTPPLHEASIAELGWAAMLDDAVLKEAA